VDRLAPTRHIPLILLLPLCLLPAPGCSRGDRALQDDVTIVASQEGTVVEQAIARVARRGRRALPPIETALHTASAEGRLNLILALRRIGDIDAVPLLRHLALHDAEDGVRKEAEFTLRQWASSGGARADAARAALRAVEEERKSEQKG
jgi:hypothetical protein